MTSRLGRNTFVVLRLLADGEAKVEMVADLLDRSQKLIFGLAALELVHLHRGPFKSVDCDLLVGEAAKWKHVVDGGVNAQKQLLPGVGTSAALQIPLCLEHRPVIGRATAAQRTPLEVASLAISIGGSPSIEEMWEKRLFATSSAHPLLHSLLTFPHSILVLLTSPSRLLFGRFFFVALFVVTSMCFLAVLAFLFAILELAFAAANAESRLHSLLFQSIPSLSSLVHALNERGSFVFSEST